MSYTYSTSSSEGKVTSGSSSGDGDGDGSDGCHVSLVHGFILVLLAVVIAVGVGIIVFFAGGREVVCQCSGSGSVVGTTRSPSAMSPEEVKGLCIDVILAGEGKDICDVCHLGSETSTYSTPTAPAPTRDYRLPITVRPYLYTLELQPNIYGEENGIFDFEGSVRIAAVADSTSKTIVLHAHPTLNITKDSIKIINVNNTQNVALSGTSYEELREFFTLHLSSDLTVGHHYAIEMSFRGPLTQSGTGLYLAYYEEAGQKVYLATSKFEAPYARKAFPCFDEPALKAQFDITLIRQGAGKRSYRSLSNAAQARQEPLANGMVRDIYERTVIMPTYLLAFIVCDYKYTENNVSNVMFRTWAMPERIAFAETAQRHGVKVFERFASYFKPEYVYSKLDNIVIPDFASGAMENWGLITYRDILLYEPGVSSASNEDWIAEVISHEVAHMWFGNLVSPRWWNWLWLNEAFASFWDYHIVGEIYPHWRKLDMSVVDSAHPAFSADSLRSSHPLTADVMTPSEITSIFDTVTYHKFNQDQTSHDVTVTVQSEYNVDRDVKILSGPRIAAIQGSAVVRMMHLVMGQDLLIEGLNHYLYTNKFDTAQHQDLWKALTETAEANNVALNMTEIMDPWVTQMNFPVVNVAINRDKGQITLTQQRFLLSGMEDAKKETGAYGYKWTIPVTYTTSDSPNFTTEYINTHIHYMKYHEDSLVLNVAVPTDGWIIVNLQECGFYRVNYDKQNWENILKYLTNDDIQVIHPINRAQIINDAWNLAKAGMLTQDVALRTVSYLSKDLDYVPWRAFIRELSYVENMLERTSLFGMFEEFIRTAVQTPYMTLGTNMTEDMPPIEKIEKGQIVSLACKYDHSPCKKKALEEFAIWRNDTTNSTIYPDLRSSYFCTAVRHGGLSEWTFAYDQYHLAVDSSEKNRLRRSLACTREPWLLQRVLEMSIDASEVRPQDTRTTITYVGTSLWGRELAWNFVTHNFDQLVDIIKSPSGLSRLVMDITEKYNTEQEYCKVEKFMNSRDVSAAGTAFTQVLERTRTNMEWLEENFEVFKEWLRSETQHSRS